MLKEEKKKKKKKKEKIEGYIGGGEGKTKTFSLITTEEMATETIRYEQLIAALENFDVNELVAILDHGSMLLNSGSEIEVKTDVKVISSVKKEMALKTEDTGKIFEMAICLAYGIEFNGKYKYDLKLAEKLKPRLSKLVDIFPMCKHTANKGARYDYTSLTDEGKHLSAKSTKKGIGKVAPQVVGQSQPKKFCKILGIEYTTISDLKRYIQMHILKIIPILVNYTFDCDNIYYNDEKSTIRYITLTTPIEWEKYEFKWTCDWTTWSNSSTLKIIFDKKEYSLLEFQFHATSRTNMAIRWCYEHFLTIFKENLRIIDF